MQQMVLYMNMSECELIIRYQDNRRYLIIGCDKELIIIDLRGISQPQVKNKYVINSSIQEILIDEMSRVWVIVQNGSIMLHEVNLDF